MAAFLDACRFNPTAGGTTDWIYSSPIPGYQNPTAAGAVNGRSYKYRAESADLSQWELGEGAYNSGTASFARTTVLYNSSGTGTGAGQSGAGTKISFSTVPQVAIVALREDLLSIEEANTFTSGQKDQASNNLGTVRAIRVQTFTASGTYTPHVKMLYCIIECQGGGGGSGGLEAVASNYTNSSGGGGGVYARLLATAATVGASQTVTIGAAGTAGSSGNNAGGTGGTTSVGSLCSANGGAGGPGAKAGVAISGGGAGGTTGTGDIVIPGGGGGAGIGVSSTTGGFLFGGWGGSSFFGGGASSQLNNAGVAGASGSGTGAAGCQDITGTTNRSGAAGGSGRVVVHEFCSA